MKAIISYKFEYFRPFYKLPLFESRLSSENISYFREFKFPILQLDYSDTVVCSSSTNGLYFDQYRLYSLFCDQFLTEDQIKQINEAYFKMLDNLNIEEIVVNL